MTKHQFVPVRRVDSTTMQPDNVEILVFTLACGHQEARLRDLYPHWQDGTAPPVRQLVCTQCAQPENDVSPLAAADIRSHLLQVAL